jgi:hypothetical protein
VAAHMVRARDLLLPASLSMHLSLPRCWNFLTFNPFPALLKNRLTPLPLGLLTAQAIEDKCSYVEGVDLEGLERGGIVQISRTPSVTACLNKARTGE